jgi:hypothetical protein
VTSSICFSVNGRTSERDVLADPDYAWAEAQRLGGYRTVLAVPMLREGIPAGLLTLTRFPPAEMGSTVMARFYFHIEDDRTHIDQIGVELPDLEAARDEAVAAAGEILRNGDAKALWTGKPWRMWVTQSPFAKEKPLFVLRFSAGEK